MFQMSSVNLTNGNYIRILMPDCCFIRLLVGYSFVVAGVTLAGAAERQEGRGSSRLLLLSFAAQLLAAFGGSRREKRVQNEKMPVEIDREAHSLVQLG